MNAQQVAKSFVDDSIGTPRSTEEVTKALAILLEKVWDISRRRQVEEVVLAETLRTTPTLEIKYRPLYVDINDIKWTDRTLT
jgi:hypothetical protein